MSEIWGSAHIGYKYLEDDGGVDLILNKKNGKLMEMIKWSDYENNGIRYLFPESNSNTIYAILYKNDDIYDSINYSNK